MCRSKKDSDVRARVDSQTRLSLELLANREQLELSDILRRAIREFLQRQIPISK